MKMLGLDPERLMEIIRAAHAVCMAVVTDHFTTENSAAVVVADQHGNSLTVYFVGQADNAHCDLQTEDALGAAVRLGGETKHLSSWQTRTGEPHEAGCAIRTRDLIISVGGFPILWSEAAALAIAERSGELNAHGAGEIAKISSNRHVRALIPALGSQPALFETSATA